MCCVLPANYYLIFIVLFIKNVHFILKHSLNSLLCNEVFLEKYQIFLNCRFGHISQTKYRFIKKPKKFIFYFNGSSSYPNMNKIKMVSVFDCQNGVEFTIYDFDISLLKTKPCWW